MKSSKESKMIHCSRMRKRKTQKYFIVYSSSCLLGFCPIENDFIQTLTMSVCFSLTFNSFIFLSLWFSLSSGSVFQPVYKDVYVFYVHYFI